MNKKKNNFDEIIPDSELEELLSKINARTLSKFITEKPYDGLRGTLPSWMPNPLKEEFDKVITYLLKDYDAEDIKNFMEQKKLLYFKLTYSRSGYIPPKIHSELDALIYIQQIYEMGPKEGVDEYNKRGRQVIHNPDLIKHHSKTGAKGGSNKKYDKDLQDFIDLLYLKAIKGKTSPTLNDVLLPLSKYSVSNPLDMSPYADICDLPFRFDDVFIGGDHLCWKNKNGEDDKIIKKNLYPYLNRSKERNR